MLINAGHKRKWEISSPQVMGIINATPDSFYESSRQPLEEAAVLKAIQMIEEGASILDIGGQSTRPGAQKVTTEEELNRVIPIIQAIRVKYPDHLISVDTFNAAVAEAAINAGANIINDISCGSFDPAILNVVSKYQAGFIGMHHTGTIETLHEIQPTTDIIKSVISFFENKKQILANYGILEWMMDPGFGFGKTIQENFTLVKRLNEFLPLQLPILLGVSRKSSIYKSINVTAKEALNGTTVLNTLGISNGASILRVHDVKEAREVIQLIQCMK